MSKHLTPEEIESRLGAIMIAYSNMNGVSQCNLNSVASLLEDGGYSIKLSDKLIERGRRTEEETTKSVAASLRRTVLFMNRVSDIAYKGTEKADLDQVIDKNIKFWNSLKEILQSTQLPDLNADEELNPLKS